MTSGANWLGSRISPELLREKEVLRFDPDLTCPIAVIICVMCFPFLFAQSFWRSEF